MSESERERGRERGSERNREGVGETQRVRVIWSEREAQIDTKRMREREIENERGEMSECD